MVVIAPMLPEPEVRDTEVEPAILPVVADIAPVPDALSVDVVPLMWLAPIEIRPLFAVVINDKEPNEVMFPVVVKS